MTEGKRIDDQKVNVTFTLEQMRRIGNALIVSDSAESRMLGEKELKFYRKKNDEFASSWIRKLWGRE